MNVAGCVDDAGRRGAFERGQQQLREQVAGEVVDREPQLIAVAALHPLAIAGDSRADAGVVDERVQTRDLAERLLGERAHLIQRRQVGS
ncbi:MAG TPA: hypothetical protein VK721_03155 [Solirubrobacteraceae bacterium]|jgi:hypothetical protein|nr:hypothetical protein [Solirubrobacteraceae bacterium]